MLSIAKSRYSSGKKLTYVLVVSFILFLTFIFQNSLCQIQFQRAIGGYYIDFANSIIQTTDGGYTIAGRSGSFVSSGYRDIYIVRLNSNGSLLWTRTIDRDDYDEASSIIQTNDGGYAVAGSTKEEGQESYFYIVKLDANCLLQWSRIIGDSSISGLGFVCYDIVQTLDGGYILSGRHGNGSDIHIVKLNSSGWFQWNQNIGVTVNTFPQDEYAYAVTKTSDGGCVVVGYIWVGIMGKRDIYVIKLNSNGIIQWSRTIGGVGYDEAYSIVNTTDGGYAIAGYTDSFGAGGEDVYVVKLDASGSLQWTRTVGGTDDDNAWSIIQTIDGGYAVAGETFSFAAGYDDDMYLVKLNASGLLQWSKTIGGTSYEEAYSIIKTLDGGYAIAGETSSFGIGSNDLYIVKFDANWNTCGNTTTRISSSGSGGTISIPIDTVNFAVSNIFITSQTFGSGGTITNICTSIGIKKISTEVPTEYSLSQNYPNPFNPTTNIRFNIPKASDVKLIIYDILGKEITTLVNEQLYPGTYEVDWPAPSGDGSGYPSGVYFYKLETMPDDRQADGFSETKRMVLVK